VVRGCGGSIAHNFRSVNIFLDIFSLFRNYCTYKGKSDQKIDTLPPLPPIATFPGSLSLRAVDF
jgi:hypothetical protein